MSVTAAGSVTKRGGISWMYKRQVDNYPETGPRLAYLALTVIATITLYYELYVGGSVSTLFLVKLHMSFSFFVYTLAFGNLIGAFGSLFAGLADRFGRTNLVVYGLLITGIMTVVVLPAATNKWSFTIEGFFVGFVEGMCLVATPALIRDFSPQVGRATAMGFWTSGPVLGSLIVFLVASHTIGGNPSPAFWVHEYKICGIVGLCVFVVAFFGLRELSPQLRDQLMVTMRDRALIEAKAKGIDIMASLRNPWRQLLKVDVLVSALGISVFLLVYYTAVGFALIYFTTVFGFSVHDGDALGNWNWGFNVIAVILFGFISDRFRVRKPFMVAGGVGAAIMMVIYLEAIGTHAPAHIGYYHLAILLAALAFCLGVAYVPWMASFTETVEDRNPALTATGLAIWGWTVRLIVFISFLIIPTVINTVTPLVNYGGTVAAASVKYSSEITFATQHPQVVATATKLAPELAAIGAHPALFTQLAAHPTPALIAQAEAAVGPATFQSIVSNEAGIQSVLPFSTQLAQLANASKQPDFQYLQKHAPAVVAAANKTGSQWKTWYWICFGCMIFFLLTIPLMRGRWSPRKAKADEDAHEAMVQAELAKLATAGAGASATPAT
ncbi:MAG: MFS transporter [Acidimicrobiales bacterium]